MKTKQIIEAEKDLKGFKEFLQYVGTFLILLGLGLILIGLVMGVINYLQGNV